MSRVLVYLLRRDLRLADNPVFHELSRLNSQAQKPFTHLLPLYVFSAQQIETSGFLHPGSQSPYPEARSSVAGFWRCGRLRAKFLAESVWDLKNDLEKAGSGLVIRVGEVGDVIGGLMEGLKPSGEVSAVWITGEDGWEEKQEEKRLRRLVEGAGKGFKIWGDEKYLVDDRDLPFKDSHDLPDVFTTFRKTVEPLRAAPRKRLPKPANLPSLPGTIPAQASPFQIPNSLDDTISALWKPVSSDMDLPSPPQMPSGVESAHPFLGGSQAAHQRVEHLLNSGAMTSYKDTRNGLLGLDFSTKLSAWLALGCISAREVHWAMVDFEDGRGSIGSSAPGYGRGENKGMAAVRFELLWRDYMRLCTRKFGSRLFFVEGYKDDRETRWKYVSGRATEKKKSDGSSDADTKQALQRFLNGTTGTSLIDASQRELFLTGWTSNRARQNVASYLAKRLFVDWRVGAEWYEANLIDYDVHSNWGNWQYVAGVGNDPRGEARVFNPVKQAFDYDGQGDYVRAWVPELRDVGAGSREKSDVAGVFQAWKMPAAEKKRLGLDGVEWVERPLVRIEYSVGGRGGAKRGRGSGGGSRGTGGRGRGRGPA